MILFFTACLASKLSTLESSLADVQNQQEEQDDRIAELERQNKDFREKLAASIQKLESTKVVQKNKSQMLLVLSEDWSQSSGVLFGYTKINGLFKQDIGETKVIFGRTGMGWGLGIHPKQSGPTKEEGDGRSPAGIFSLVSAFGYAESNDTRLSYQKVDPEWYCVDDSNDSRYNSVVHWPKTQGEKPWSSAEKMRRTDSLYELGIVVDHNQVNTNKSQAKQGSCIFLHLWRSQKGNTAGCTAMSKESMLQILQWLDPESHPVLVQLPFEEYERLQEEWSLPVLKREDIFSP